MPKVAVPVNTFDKLLKKKYGMIKLKIRLKFFFYKIFKVCFIFLFL